MIIFEERLTHLITLFWLSFQLQGGNKGQTHFFSIPQAHISSDSERQSRCKCRAEVHFTFWLITYAGVCVSSVDQGLCYTCFSSTFAQFMLSIHLNFASACSAVLPYWGSSQILKSQFKLFNRSVMWCVWLKNRVHINIYSRCKINVSAGVW